MQDFIQLFVKGVHFFWITKQTILILLLMIFSLFEALHDVSACVPIYYPFQKIIGEKYVNIMPNILFVDIM